VTLGVGGARDHHNLTVGDGRRRIGVELPVDGAAARHLDDQLRFTGHRTDRSGSEPEVQ
jgi:hypothetical protein